MQAVLLAAGQSSRFYPFNKKGHKSYVTLLGKPIIYHTLGAIHKSGINDVIIVVAKNDEFCTTLQHDLPELSITFVEQKEALGMGDALLQVRDHIKGDFFLTHAHHIEFDHFYQEMLEKKAGAEGVFLAKEDTQLFKYGVLRMEGENVREIVEKPAAGTEPSKLRLLGIYLLPQSFLSTLENTPTEHYNFEKALSEFSQDHIFHVSITKEETITLKYPWELLSVSHYLLSHIVRKISEKAVISPTATIEGDVIIEEGVVVSDGARIKGPCFIGRNSYIGDNSIVRTFSSVEDGCVIGAHCEIKNSIFMEGSKIHSGFVGDSIIGSNVRLAAAFNTANRKLDRSSIGIQTEKGPLDTGLTSLGVMIGDNTSVGLRVSTMPGVVVGTGTIIGPSTTVMKNVPDSTKYYTTFKEVVEKR